MESQEAKRTSANLEKSSSSIQKKHEKNLHILHINTSYVTTFFTYLYLPAAYGGTFKTTDIFE
jgi:hypothetical protein